MREDPMLDRGAFVVTALAVLRTPVLQPVIIVALLAAWVVFDVQLQVSEAKLELQCQGYFVLSIPSMVCLDESVLNAQR
jgi:hypothetical protein